jgi:ElaB/YqjD/DUF883 family membrane-anchored ribosome-binding protein
MASAFGNQPGGNTSPPTGGNTEFERSISRSVETDGNASSSLRDEIDADVSAVKKAAENATQTVTDKAAEVAEQQKGYAADQIEHFARALEKVGDEMQSQQPGAVGDYTKRLGTSARQFAERVHDKDLGQIASIAEDFGRRQPLAFLGLAAVAGLAASRFLMASNSHSATATPPRTGSSTPSTPYSGTKETYNG